MISNLKNRIILLLLLLSLAKCSLTKEQKENRIEYAKYLVSRNIDPIKANDLDYYDDFFNFKKEQKKKALIQSKIIKLDKVYLYNRSSDSFTLTVFGSDSRVHIATIYLGEYLELNDSIFKFKKPVPLRVIGIFELKKDTIKVLRFEKTPFKEWAEIDVGYIKNDTIVYTSTYIAKKREYKKKWLAKTHKTNFSFGYQPNLVATLYPDAFGGYYSVKGYLEFKKS